MSFFDDPNFHHIDTPQTFHVDDESQERIHLIHVDNDKTDEEVKAWVEHNFPATFCQHSYDCCGRFYANNPRWWRVPYTDRVVIHQTFRLNI